MQGTKMFKSIKTLLKDVQYLYRRYISGFPFPADQSAIKEVVWTDENHLLCKIRYFKDDLHCGYVELPQNHPWYPKNIPDNLRLSDTNYFLDSDNLPSSLYVDLTGCHYYGSVYMIGFDVFNCSSHYMEKDELHEYMTNLCRQLSKAIKENA